MFWSKAYFLKVLREQMNIYIYIYICIYVEIEI